jgi:hypothetical protein
MCEILDFIGQNLAGPILAAIIGGPLVAVGFRYFAIPGEVAAHDARAVEFNTNLRRWIGDRNLQLMRELRTLVNQANMGIVSRYPISQEERPPLRTGSQLYSGALISEAVAGMRQALHEYRDEASDTVRKYAALARSEGRWHRWYRRQQGRHPISLLLRDEEIAILNEWRQRSHPVEGDKTIGVADDPTEGERDIAPLEESDGFTWQEAQEFGTL